MRDKPVDAAAKAAQASRAGTKPHQGPVGSTNTTVPRMSLIGAAPKDRLSMEAGALSPSRKTLPGSITEGRAG